MWSVKKDLIGHVEILPMNFARMGLLQNNGSTGWENFT